MPRPTWPSFRKPGARCSKPRTSSSALSPAANNAIGRARVPQAAASPADSLVYVVRYATHIVGHRVKREAWDAEPSARALCGVRMTLDIFEKPLVGQCGEVECKRCVSLAAKLG